MSGRKETKTLVCDIGNGSIKVGVAGKLSPIEISPCTNGCPNYSQRKKIDSVSDILIGNGASKHSKFKNTGHRPTIGTTGHVQDWKALETILERALQVLGISDYNQHKILVTRPHNMREKDLKRLMDFFFIDLGFSAVTVHEQAALVLYTQGVETGVVVELGESMANVVPIYKGHAMPILNRSLAVGGRSISSYLLKLLSLKGFPMDEDEDIEIGRKIKEQVCFASLDPKVDERLAAETTILNESFKLPNGTIISVGRERFGAVEALFQPALLNIESSGLSNIIVEVIKAADIDCRTALYRNVILSGGTSLLLGLQERLQRDLNLQYMKEIMNGNQLRPTGWKPQWKPKVQAPPCRQHLVFEGAALFADYISNDEKYWISKEEYKRDGMKRVTDKCSISSI